MKKIMRNFGPGALCAAALALAGCASLRDKMADSPQETDYAKVNAIEAVARARGVSIYWYRYPTKPVVDADKAQQKQ